ncbi:hypothetical protein QQP08_023110 [Theobroma cacao]|nr:hypothetical protein QQP08_023110 [Theobroma cacao]
MENSTSGEKVVSFPCFPVVTVLKRECTERNKWRLVTQDLPIPVPSNFQFAPLQPVNGSACISIKCVNKECNEIISNPRFAAVHAARTPSKNRHNLGLAYDPILISGHDYKIVHVFVIDEDQEYGFEIFSSTLNSWEKSNPRLRCESIFEASH